jgi:hydrogenase maturation protease
MSTSVNPKTLVIAYGNRDRQDDGAGWHILAHAASQLGLPAPELPGEWTESEDGSLRLLYLYQLLPELAEDLIDYSQIIFVDAHNAAELPELVFEPVSPAWVHSAFTHHLSIGELLAITQTLYGRCPAAWMLSVRGYAFEFSQTLSPQTAALVNQAAALLCSHLHPEASPNLPKERQKE